MLMSLMRGIGKQMRRIVVFRFGRRMRCGVTLQWMDSARIVVLRRWWRRSLLPHRALHPGWRRRRFFRFGIRIAVVVIVVVGRRRLGRPCPGGARQIGPAFPGPAAERIVLANQTRQLGKGIAFGIVGRSRPPVAIVIATGRKGSVLISIRHRDDVSPQGKVANPLFATGPRRLPLSKSPGKWHVSQRISFGAPTPRTPRPDAKTVTTRCTIASRAFVISASLLIIKRK